MAGFRLGRIFGIDVHVHGSWLLIVGLVMWSLASAALPQDYPMVTGAGRFAMAGAITALFFLSLLAHELSHSLVAMARGIPVHRITFFLFGGMAQTSTDSRSPGEEFQIAVAGPVMSLVLAALSLGVWYVAARAGWTPLVTGSAAYIAVLNLVMALFNMLPGFPMDGGRVLRAAVWKATGDVTRATRWAARVGSGMALLLMAYGIWQVFTVDVVGGIWLVLIGWFIRHAARSSYQQHLMGRMQDLVQESFHGSSHGHPFRPGPAGWPQGPEPGRTDPPRRRAPLDGPGGRPEGGRDVTRLGGPER